MYGDHFARVVGVKAGAFDHEAVTQAHFVSDEQAEKAFDRLHHEIVLLNPQFTRKTELALSHFRVVRVYGRMKHSSVWPSG